METIVLLIPKNNLTPFAPIMFGIIPIPLIIWFASTMKKLEVIFKDSSPELYEKNTVEVFGLTRLPRNTFLNQKVIDSLPPEGKKLINTKKYFYIYMFICFSLFVLSNLLTSLK